MTLITAPYRPAALALCLLALSATGGCAHFHNAEVRAQERAAGQPSAPKLAEAVPLPMPAPTSPARVPKVADQAISAPPAPAVSQAAVAVPPAPTSAAPPVARLVMAPATADAVIVFANTQGPQCGTCETLKISVAPSGQVLIERGYWAGRGNWRYKRSRANVSQTRAAAFAASLSGNRPSGAAQIGSASCPAPRGDGLSIEWIEADRDDLLTVKPDCPSGGSDPVAERLRHAPDLLGLRQLTWP